VGLGIRDKWELFKLWRRREKMFAKLGSRKLWAAVLGAALVALGGQLGIADETTTKIVELVMVYIVGQSVVDATGAIKGKQ
jgi:hypothetical protein